MYQAKEQDDDLETEGEYKVDPENFDRWTDARSDDNHFFNKGNHYVTSSFTSVLMIIIYTSLHRGGLSRLRLQFGRTLSTRARARSRGPFGE